MKNIENIIELKDKCTGCMACIDACPTKCITSMVGNDGFIYSKIDCDKCINCGKCYTVCPIENSKKSKWQQRLFAAYSNVYEIRNSGSSGGIFELLANEFIERGYYVCGAAFDNTTLKHCIVHDKENLKPLLKSKYIQSNMEGVYTQIIDLLINGEKVFYCGTPCQVSALKNIVPEKVNDRLFTADIICHGVPSQKVFDDYLQTLEKKHGCKVYDFSFRVKDNKYKHSHGYSYKLAKNGKTINGIYTKSSFYNAFKNYSIFRNSCYDCQYATLERVSDITLADFWGIEKYDFSGNVDKGVSMIVANTENGLNAFMMIEDKIVSKEFPIQYGIDSNYCLTHSTKKPKNRDVIISELSEKGYEQTAKKYFKCKFIYKLYWLIPSKLRNLIRGKNRGL